MSQDRIGKLRTFCPVPVPALSSGIFKESGAVEPSPNTHLNGYQPTMPSPYASSTVIPPFVYSAFLAGGPVPHVLLPLVDPTVLHKGKNTRPRSPVTIFQTCVLNQCLIPRDVPYGSPQAARYMVELWNRMSDDEKGPWIKLGELELKKFEDRAPGPRGSRVKKVRGILTRNLAQ